MRPATAQINIANLKHNFKQLQARAKEAEVMAVVKANAYGHGLDLIAPALADAGCRHFAVTDAVEGARLRKLLPDAKSILLLSGVFDSSDAELTCKHRLTPVITCDDQLLLLNSASFKSAVWIKIDTGMQRLGAEQPQQLIEKCRKQGVELAGIMSHLACADSPEHPLNRVQAEAFTSLHQQLAPESAASLLNSAGIVTLPDKTFDFIRPGIALYGVEPVPTEPMGLKPVMQLTGQVMQLRHVSKGRSISYGASFTAPDDMQIAIVTLGYGDGLPRQLSNRGIAFHEKSSFPIVGRICMDFCLIDCTGSDLKTGETIEFWGEKQSAANVANTIDTITYELFTGISERVIRKKI